MRRGTVTGLVLLGLALVVGGCSNTVSGLAYAPVPSVAAGTRPAVGAVVATDRRKEEPHLLATIMGGFGNPLKQLRTPKPVKDEVADAVTEGLRARGLLAAGGAAPFRVELVVRTFDADMIIGRTARIDLGLAVIDGAGRTVYEDAVTDSQSETKFFQTGILADINELKALCEIVLARAVDGLLDKPGFRAAVAGGA